MAIFTRMQEFDYEQLVFCQDQASGLKAIICIHDTTLGPALGGVRMYPYASDEDALVDVLRLARGMTYKAAVSGLNLGGGKGVILGDPRAMKSETLFRTFGRFVESLNGRYITAEDVGTSLEDMTWINMETNFVTGTNPTKGGSGDPSPVTAKGVHIGIKACWKAQSGIDSLNGLTVAVQGLGHVGYYLCSYLHQEGARLIVTDVNEEAVRRVVNEFGAEAVSPDEIYGVSCDIFAPCALGAIINDKTIPQLKCAVVAGAANNQLAEARHGKVLMDKGIIYAPDYVINAGGLMNVYEELAGYNKERAFRRVESLFGTISSILETARKSKIPTSEAADFIAEERIRRIRQVQSVWVQPKISSAGR